MLQITFKGAQNWFDISGELYRLWDSEDNYYFSNRPTPFNAEISSSKGEWNGKLFDVQHVKYEGWYLQFIINEEYVHSFADIHSCETIEVNDLDNGIEQVLNIDVIENLEIDIYPTGNGTVYVVSMTYRTNKIIIDKGAPKLNLNSIDLIQSSSLWFETIRTDVGYGLDKITKLSETRIAAISGLYLRLFELQSGSWVEIGVPKYISTLNNPDICTLSEISVCIVNDGTGTMQAYRLATTLWVELGNSIDLPGTWLNCAITSLSETRVAVIDENNKNLSAYDLSGVTWSLTGSVLYIMDLIDVEITKLTSTTIVLLDTNVGNLRTYVFNGSTWSLTVDTGVSISGEFSMYALSETRVVFYDNTDNDLRIYDLSGSWSQYGIDFPFAVSSNTVLTGIDEISIAITNSDSDELIVLNLEGYRYYTDNDILINKLPIEENKIKLSDGTEIVSKRTIKNQYSALFYFNTYDARIFEDRLYSAITIKLNDGSTAYTMELIQIVERTQAGEDYHAVVCRFISDTTIIDSDLTSEQNSVLTLDATPYYSDDIPIPFTNQEPKIEVEFPTGQKKIGMTTTKKGWIYALITSKSTAATIIEKWLESDTLTLDGTGISSPFSILERTDITEEEISETQTKLSIKCIEEITRKYFNLNPSGTYSLVITRTGHAGSPWTYTTDFPLTVLYEDGEQETVDNNQGLNISAKNITKEITRAIFYVNRATANLIKYNFELGGVVTIAGTPVLETRSVNPNELASDLYEVIVDCVTGSEVYYPNS